MRQTSPARFRLWRVNPAENHDDMLQKITSIMQHIANFYGQSFEPAVLIQPMSFVDAAYLMAEPIKVRLVPFTPHANNLQWSLPIIACDKHADEPVVLLPAPICGYFVVEPFSRSRRWLSTNAITASYDEMLLCIPLGSSATYAQLFPSLSMLATSIILTACLGVLLLALTTWFADMALVNKPMIMVGSLLLTVLVAMLIVVSERAQKNYHMTLVGLTNRLYHQLVRLPREKLSQFRTQDLARILTQIDTQSRALFRDRAHVYVFSTLLIGIAGFFYMWWWQFLLVLIFFAGVLIYLFRARHNTEQVEHANSDETARIWQQYGDALSSFKDLHAERYLLKKINRRQTKAAQIFLQHRFIYFLWSACGFFIPLIVLIKVIGSGAFINQTFNSLSTNLSISILALAGALCLWCTSLALQKIYPWFKNRTQPLFIDDPQAPAKLFLVPVHIVGRVEIENLSVTYVDQTVPIIKNLSLIIEEKTVHVFHGPSGSGKTTILKLLLTLMKPDAGQILYDGQDTRSLDYIRLCRHFGVMFTTSQSFSGSIYQNIICDRNLSPASLEKLLLSHEIFDALLDLPLGLATYVYWHGKNLSHFQKQLIFLARAMVHEPRLLFLDEPFANLSHEQQEMLGDFLSSLPITRIITSQMNDIPLKTTSSFALGDQV